MKRTTLEKIINEILFEDVSYGIYDRPAYAGATDDDESDPEFDPTVKPDVPIQPQEMMASQLADVKPPIDDEKYVPTSISDLRAAASAIAENVPADQIEQFYRKLHMLLDQVTDDSRVETTASLEDQEVVDEEPIEPQKESLIRESSWDDETDLYGNQWDEDSGDNLSVFDPAAEEMSSTADDQNTDAASLEQIAAEFGFSGAPGARQHIDKLTSRMQYFAMKLNKKDVAALQDRAVGAFIDEMKEAELIDDNDAADLITAPAAVKGLDSFRFFFVAGFVMPAYLEVQREARKRVEKEMENLKIPKEMQQTVLNQALGNAARNPGAIVKKLDKVAMKLKLSKEERSEIATNLTTGFAALVKLAEPSDDLIEKSLSKWDSMASNKRQKILKQSLEQTNEFQAEDV